VLGDSEINASQFRATEAAGRALSVQVLTLEIRHADDLAGAFGTAARSKAGAVLLLSSPLTLAHRRQIADLAVTHRLPTMFVYRSHVDTGGLMSYGPNLPDMFRQCGVYVARILAGSKPAEMPVERPTVFELVINLKTAKGLGLTIPPSLLQRADQVIE
jgi:putative ABC transport system substrate-binding protein